MPGPLFFYFGPVPACLSADGAILEQVAAVDALHVHARAGSRVRERLRVCGSTRRAHRPSGSHSRTLRLIGALVRAHVSSLF